MAFRRSTHSILWDEIADEVKRNYERAEGEAALWNATRLDELTGVGSSLGLTGKEGKTFLRLHFG